MPVCRRTHENGTKTAEVRGLRFPEKPLRFSSSYGNSEQKKRPARFVCGRKDGTFCRSIPHSCENHAANPRRGSRDAPFIPAETQQRNAAKHRAGAPPARHSSLQKQFRERLRSQACGQERRILPLQKCGRPRLFLPSPLPFRPRRKRCGPTASGLSEDLPRKYEQVHFAPKLRRTRQSPVKNKPPGYGRPCRKKGMFGKQKGRRKEKDAPSKVERTREKDRAEARNGDGKISTPLFPSSPFGRENCARHIAGRL